VNHDLSRWQQVCRFILVGGLNTGITYVLYLTLSLAMVPPIAYGIAYITGIGIAFAANGRWVFRSPVTSQRILPYVLMQIMLLIIGTSVSWMLTGRLPPWLIGITSIATILPLSFISNAIFFRRKKTTDTI
jgi:putative flippase GtrA